MCWTRRKVSVSSFALLALRLPALGLSGGEMSMRIYSLWNRMSLRESLSFLFFAMASITSRLVRSS